MIDGGQLWFYQELQLEGGATKTIDVWPLLISIDDDVFTKMVAEGGHDFMGAIALMYRAAAIADRAESADYSKRRDCEQSVRWASEAVEGGSTDYSLMLLMGDLYRDGCGVKADANLADSFARRGVKLAIEAAEKPDRIAMYELGWSYYNGIGAPHNMEEAVRWMLRAKDLGFSAAADALEMWSEK